MALIQCKECNTKVSTKSENCTSCGAPVKKGITIGGIIKWLFLIFFGAIIYQCAGPKSSNETPTQKTEQQISEPKHQDDGKQPQRLALIQSMQENDIIYKIEIPGSLPHVLVSEGFYTLPYDDKTQLMSVIFLYYAIQDPSIDLIVLHNWKTNKKIGRYTPDYGLTLD